MAKGNAMGLWRGKKGSSVFYRIANSNNQQKQGIRERNYEPANPQTTRQASQRLKLLPAQRVYGMLKPVIERAWQGVKYGQMSRQKYLRYALGMTSGYPYIEKDDNRTVPGEYLVSKGDLQQVFTTYEDIDEHQTSLRTGSDTYATIGQLSTTLITENDGIILEGDQITMVACFAPVGDMSAQTLLGAQYVWKYGSFFVSQQDMTALNTLDLFQEGRRVWLDINADGLVIRTDTALCASAIIVSRDVDGTPKRSTATLFVPDAVKDAWTSEAQITSARRSYQRRENGRSTDWPVEDQEGTETPTEGSYTLSGLTGSAAWANGRDILVLKYPGTGLLAAYYYIDMDQPDINVLVDAETRTELRNPSELDDWLTPSQVPELSGLVGIEL